MTPPATRYYTLVCSLPAMPHFERAERLPINRYRLDQRLRMLEPDDAAQLVLAEDLIAWRPRRPLAKSGAEIRRQYRALADRLHPALREFVDFRMDQQTVMAALRRKQSGAGPPSGDLDWGAGRKVPWVEKHWDDPDLRLGQMMPWIPEARGCLESGDAVSLERLLMNAAWRQLSRIADANLFGFEAVMAYVFRWDILMNWLEQDADKGKGRFQELIKEVIDGQQR